jgi:hypothetical protein
MLRFNDSVVIAGQIKIHRTRRKTGMGEAYVAQ